MGSETIAQPGEFDVEEQTQKMVNDLVAASKSIDAKIDSLPDVEQSDLEREHRIVELWKRHNQLDETLQNESNQLQQVLAELQEVWVAVRDTSRVTGFGA